MVEIIDSTRSSSVSFLELLSYNYLGTYMTMLYASFLLEGNRKKGDNLEF